MKKPIYISDYSIVTPLGFTVKDNLSAIQENQTAIALNQDQKLPEPYWAASISDQALELEFTSKFPGVSASKIEKMLLLALEPIWKEENGSNQRVGLILSTTKGDIEKLGQNDLEGAHLHKLAQKIADHFGIPTQPIVLSNACVSGVMALSVGKRLMESGMYDQIYVIAADLVSGFVLSGFNSFQAMSPEPCRPYSANRKGVNLGEAAAACLLSFDPTAAKAQILGDASKNDANHISGPSRTGEGLYISILAALEEAGIAKDEIGFISAHGTATPYNDEMEAIALNRLQMGHIPIHSLKGYYGHTLGASGLLESLIGIEAMNRNLLIASAGFDTLGVSEPIAVIQEHKTSPISCFLKTASGFGGSNTALIFKKP